MGARVSIEPELLAEFCRRWGIAEFAFFGSVLRADFGPHSDIDILVEFRPEVRVGFMELAAMEDELAGMFGRPIDLVSKRGLNPRIRDAVLESREVAFAA